MSKVSIIFIIIITFIIIIFPSASYAQSSEESSVNKFNHGLFPAQVAEEKRDEGVFEELKQLLGQLFFNTISKIGTFYPQTENLSQSEVPPEVKPKSTDSLFENLWGFLGKSFGFYAVNLPSSIATPSTNVRDAEKFYEDANFPENINPVTGQ